MTELDQHISVFALKAILRAGQAVTESFLKSSIRTGFAHLAFTEADLGHRISSLETGGLISGTTDSILGIIWDLTPTGKIRAQQLS